MTLRDLENLNGGLSPGEKARVLQWVAHDLGNSAVGIDVDPKVSGGEACIVPYTHPGMAAGSDARAGNARGGNTRQLSGIIDCTFDPDFAALAQRIHDAITAEGNLGGKLVRVNRPSTSA